MKTRFSRVNPIRSPRIQLTRLKSLPIFRPGSCRVWTLLAAAALLAAAFALPSAETGPGADAAAATPPAEEWVRGTDDDKFKLLSKHLRGLDVTMVETGYRYTELFWAGQDRNWEFAAYQLDKIRHTIELGIERRPKRAASALGFLTNAIPFMKQSIDKKDAPAFEAQFKLLTVACNNCHALEKMAFVQVHPPEQRHSPVRFTAP